jgi:hypothetical protein
MSASLELVRNEVTLNLKGDICLDETPGTFSVQAAQLRSAAAY